MGYAMVPGRGFVDWGHASQPQPWRRGSFKKRGFPGGLRGDRKRTGAGKGRPRREEKDFGSREISSSNRRLGVFPVWRGTKLKGI